MSEQHLVAVVQGFITQADSVSKLRALEEALNKCHWMVVSEMIRRDMREREAVTGAKKRKARKGTLTIAEGLE